MSFKRFSCFVSVSVFPVSSSPIHFFPLQCLASVCLAVYFVLLLVLCFCFALVFLLVFPLLLHRVFSRVFRLARGGVFLSLLCLVHVVSVLSAVASGRCRVFSLAFT